MARLFISLPRLDQLIENEEAIFEQGVLRLESGLSLQLQAAVHFEEVIGGREDPHSLLGTVKTAEQLDSLGAEHYQDSVLLGDWAYRVMEGFIGEPQ